MQRHTHPGSRFAAVALLLGLGVALGCGGNTVPTATSSEGGATFAGVALTLACADPVFAQDLTNRCAGWAARTGATVQVQARPPAEVPTADVAVIAPAELGALAVGDQLAPVPVALKAGEHPLQWGRMAPIYRLLSSWGRDAVALPLAGDGYVLVYRSDRLAEERHQAGFARRHGGRTLAPPATWEEVADVAEYFFETNRQPSLPPLPADRARLLALFHLLAASYDRRAMADADPSARKMETGPTIHFRPESWEPRLDAPAFAAAADWFASTHRFRPAGGADDPVQALEQGNAVLTVLSLAEVGRLPKDPATGAIAERYRVMPLPGTRGTFGPEGKLIPAGRQGNYVPVVGLGGKLGVVFRRSPSSDAAWDLLAHLASPASSVVLLSNPAVGSGPFRTEHVDAGAKLWLGYRFDEERTRDLATAAVHYLGLNVVNPVLALRTPDQGELSAALEAEVRRAATGQATGPQAMQRAQAAWKDHDARHKREELVQWRRNAAGLP